MQSREKTQAKRVAAPLGAEIDVARQFVAASAAAESAKGAAQKIGRALGQFIQRRQEACDRAAGDAWRDSGLRGRRERVVHGSPIGLGNLIEDSAVVEVP